ncbi:NAD(P)/FAD-dependent oxidoreductase [Streptomyces sp. NPDC057474]|uniref:NAD(P)/FAD-dependent oxidoreductase n=1 Tax=Streptomyces sp. NPDC057474 TaxID=3346144 RepID=UPI00368F254F
MIAGVVIVGAGQAGVDVATGLRRQGYEGPVTVVGEEPGAPYQRPPLSKEFLLGTADENALTLHTERFYADNSIQLHTGTRVDFLDTTARVVRLADGHSLPYTDLVLATGAVARRLTVPGTDLNGVVTLRSLADAHHIRERLAHVHKVVVVGGGFVGLEFAAVLSGRAEVEVTVIGHAERLLRRSVSAPLSAHVADVHRSRGVKLVFGQEVAEILGQDEGHVTGVRDGEGRTHEADLVVVGIGAEPRTDLARAAGLKVDDGIVVDDRLRTSAPNVYAVGDCARCAGVRLESVQNATGHAAHVARAIAVGDPGPYRDLPWFWSNQKGLRLQMAGVTAPDDELQVLGDASSGRFSVLAFRGGRLVAVESVNSPADHVAARTLLGGARVVTPNDTSKPGFRLRSLTAAAKAAV